MKKKSKVFAKKMLSLLLAVAMIITCMPVHAEAATDQTIEISVGETKTLRSSSLLSKTTWESSDDTVATVSKKGDVTGVSVGTATVTGTIKSMFNWFGSKSTVKTYEIIVIDGQEETPDEPAVPEKPEIDKNWIGVFFGKFFENIWGNGGINKPNKPSKPDKPSEPEEKKYTVTFETNGGSIVESQIVEEGQCIVEPEDPEKEGFIFENWYVDEDLTELYDFEMPVTSDITLYAAWDEEPIDITGDDDNDGLSNGIESAFGLSDETNDTDGDGIDDYTEIYLIGSDPTINDSNEDTDADGLTNYEEIFDYKTDASKVDTDFDGLADDDEVNDYGTDPLAADTDNDGADDGLEIELGTDPLTADESFQINQSAQNEDNVEASVDIELSGEQVDTLEIKPVDTPVFFPEDMPGYLGMAYNFSVDGEFDSATISFEFDASILEDGAEPTIFYFNEETQELEELETTISGNIASTKVEHFSKYILIDRKVYYDSFTWEDVWDTEAVYHSVEIVLVIDDSGSMSSNDGSNQRLTVAQNLIDKLPEDSKIGIVWFASSTNMLTSELLTDREAAKAYLTTDYFKSSGGTYMYNAINSAFSLFESTEDDVLKMMVVLSDGATSDTSIHSSTISTAQENDVRIYTVGLGNSTSYFNNYLKPLAENTSGAFYLASNADELANIYEDINKKIDLEADADDDDIPDYYEDNMIAFNGTKIEMDKNDADTDDDGLKDNEEVEIELVYNEDKTKVYIKGKMWSDPTLKDSDYDGVDDNYELEKVKRLDNSFSGAMSGYYDIDNAEYSFDYKEFFNSSSIYSDEICSSSLIFANTIYSDCGFTYNSGAEITSIKELMEQHGFDKVINYKLDAGFENADGISVEKYTDDDISEIGIGYNEVTYNGATKTIIGVVIRGTNGTIEEWSSNFDMGDPDSWDYDYHKGFYTTEERIKKFVDQYVDVYLNGTTNFVYWITGHSRGAALSNLLAARLIDEGNTVFAYTFATPSTTISSSRNDAKYNSIFNFANSCDIVTYVPLVQWEFGAYGVTQVLNVEELGLSSTWCEKTGESAYEAYNRNVITVATDRIAKSCSTTWAEVHDRAGSQDIDDEQYGWVSTRAKRYCDITERTSILGNHKGYKLYPSTAFVFQLLAEYIADENREHVTSLLPEFWNSKYMAVIILFAGDALNNKDSFEGATLDIMKAMGDGHAPATYYVLTQCN